MEPDLAHALTQFVNHATSLLDAGTAQLPAILTDIVAYQLLDAWFTVCLGIGFLALAAVGFLLYASSEDNLDWKEPVGFFSALGGLVFGALFTLSGIYHIYYVTHFPRLVILDYLKEVVK